MIDIHSHTPGSNAIYNLTIDELRLSPPYIDLEQRLSAGIHPWDVSEMWEKDFSYVKKWASLHQVKAIGECGLDNLVPSAYQEECFVAHILLAEEVEKPLIIHCVKAVDALLSIKKNLHPSQPWIFHGFRGKPQQAEQLLKAGFYLSFGEHFNPLSVQKCPMERLCIETDTSAWSIEEIEKRIQMIHLSTQESYAKDLFLK